MTSDTPIDDAPPQPAATSFRATISYFAQRPWLMALVLVVVTFLAYQPTWRAGFIWDDDDHVTANPAMTSFHGLKMIWSTLATARYYPLTLTTFWIERHLWGLHPLPYHLVDVLFHAANAVLVFFLLRRLRIPAAWLAAMVWALHPVNVESAAWITETKNTQSGLFFFSSLLLFLRFDEEKHSRLRWYTGYLAGVWYLCACVCGAGAMMSKASTAILPMALLLAVWWQRGYAEWPDAVRITPFFGMAWLVSGLTIVEQHGHIVRAGDAGSQLGAAARFVVAGKVVWFYAAKILWPVRLTFVYPRWDVHALSVGSWVPLAALVAVSVALWRGRDRAWCRAALFGGGYFIVALLPVLGFFDIFFFRYSFVSDHFQYLASVGIIALVCAGAAAFWKRTGSGDQRLAAIAAASVLVALGILTWRQARIYQDLETLWRDTIAKDPQCWMAQNNLGVALESLGRGPEAIGHFEQALRMKPDYAEAQNNLGMVLESSGRTPEAIEHFEEALRLDPDFGEAHNNLGMALASSGRVPEAIEHFQQALRIKPDLTEAYYNLGVSLGQTGKIAEGIEYLKLAVRLNPNLKPAQTALAQLQARQ